MLLHCSCNVLKATPFNLVVTVFVLSADGAHCKPYTLIQQAPRCGHRGLMPVRNIPFVLMDLKAASHGS